MLKIKIRRPVRTTIPKSPEYKDVQSAVREVIGSVNPSKALSLIKPTKTFIKARLNGSSNAEAKALAGIPPSKAVNKVFEHPVSKLLLEEVLADDVEFGDKGIVKRLKHMWHAKDNVYIPTDSGVIKRKKVNWDVRKFAFTNVLELRGYKSKKSDGDGAPQATQIIFNVTPIPGQVPIDVKGEIVK